MRMIEGMFALVDNGVVGVDVSLLLQDVKTFLNRLLVAVEHRLVLLQMEEGVKHWSWSCEVQGHRHVMARAMISILSWPWSCDGQGHGHMMVRVTESRSCDGQGHGKVTVRVTVT